LSYLDLKQAYCRDLRDCQTYFPCAVFSSGFSYLYVIKRCQHEQIFDEQKQKCVKNTLDDATCAKRLSMKKARTSTVRSLRLRTNDEHNSTGQQRHMKLPVVRSSLTNSFQRKTLDFDRILSDTTQAIPSTESSMKYDHNHYRTGMHRVCYVTNWSRYRTGDAKFEIEFIDPFMCTHIIYAYATVDQTKPEIVPIQKEDIGQ
jgi:hypothetical protein